MFRSAFPLSKTQSDVIVGLPSSFLEAPMKARWWRSCPGVLFLGWAFGTPADVGSYAFK